MGSTQSSRLLIDANLLVLFVVGTVNRNRIGTFKRTSKYTPDDYDLLLRIATRFGTPLLTLPHVLAEVSNLSDMSGPEAIMARRVVKELIEISEEIELSSISAVEHKLYEALGLTDAAIGAVAQIRGCIVLTDDLNLYLGLHQIGVTAYNFAHLQAQNWEEGG